MSDTDSHESPLHADENGRLAENIVYFARILRNAGMTVGTSSTLEAVKAVEIGGISNRDDFYWTLHSVMVKCREDRVIFDEAFRLFWRSRDLVEKLLQMFSPVANPTAEQEPQRAGQSRVNQSLFPEATDQRKEDKTEIEIDAVFTASQKEVLHKRDFAQMSAEELAQARQELSKLVLPFPKRKTRRFIAHDHVGKIDLRRTLSGSMRLGGDLLMPRYKIRKNDDAPLVILADISGSMSQYTRIFLHFFHAMTNQRSRVHTFLFGTRLTNVTRQLKNKDPDEALAECSEAVEDWSGGTRIGETVRQFNLYWSRRVLSQGAMVLMITDGLERDGGDEDHYLLLERELDRLHRSCRKLVWLNPLLRYDLFQAKARGIRAMLPHVDEFRAVHSLDALSDLCESLSDRQSAGNRNIYSPEQWLN